MPTTVKAKLVGEESMLSSIVGKITEVAAQVTGRSTSSDVESLKSSIETVEADVKELKSTIATQNAQISSQDKKIELQEEELRELRKTVTAIEDFIYFIPRLIESIGDLAIDILSLVKDSLMSLANLAGQAVCYAWEYGVKETARTRELNTINSTHNKTLDEIENAYKNEPDKRNNAINAENEAYESIKTAATEKHTASRKRFAEYMKTEWEQPLTTRKEAMEYTGGHMGEIFTDNKKARQEIRDSVSAEVGAMKSGLETFKNAPMEELSKAVKDAQLHTSAVFGSDSKDKVLGIHTAKIAAALGAKGPISVAK